MLPRTAVRADLPSRDRHAHRSSMGDREGPRADLDRALSRHGPPASWRRRPRARDARMGTAHQSSPLEGRPPIRGRRHRARGGASRRDLAQAGVLPAWRRGSRRRRRPGCGPQVVRGLDRRRTGRAALPRREGRRRPAREPRVSGRPRVLTPVAALRLGLAGAGRMGRNHLRAIAGSAVVKVTAIAEPVASTRSLLQGADSALYGSLVDMGVHEFDQTRWLVQQEFGAITSVASGIAGERWPGDPESAHAIAELSGGTTAIVSLGRRFPLGDVCKVEVFGTKDAEECKFLWPPTADDTFFGALRLQAESFARHVRGGPLEGASAHDAAAALDAAERAAAQTVTA